MLRVIVTLCYYAGCECLGLLCYFMLLYLILHSIILLCIIFGNYIVVCYCTFCYFIVDTLHCILFLCYSVYIILLYITYSLTY